MPHRLQAEDEDDESRHTQRDNENNEDDNSDPHQTCEGNEELTTRSATPTNEEIQDRNNDADNNRGEGVDTTKNQAAGSTTRTQGNVETAIDDDADVEQEKKETTRLAQIKLFAMATSKMSSRQQQRRNNNTSTTTTSNRLASVKQDALLQRRIRTRPPPRGCNDDENQAEDAFPPWKRQIMGAEVALGAGEQGIPASSPKQPAGRTRVEVTTLPAPLGGEESATPSVEQREQRHQPVSESISSRPGAYCCDSFDPYCRC